MALKTFEVPIILTFNGFVRVKAASLQTAYKKAEDLWDRDIDVKELEGVSIDQQVLADDVAEVDKPRKAPKKSMKLSDRDAVILAAWDQISYEQQQVVRKRLSKTGKEKLDRLERERVRLRTRRRG